MATPVTKKRHELSLKEKYQLIMEARKSSSLNAKILAEQFACGKTQIYSILKNKAKFIDLYERNAPDLQRCGKRSRPSKYTEVNDLLYDWYLVAVRKNIYPNGPTLCQQALEIVKHLDLEDFKASNGWLGTI